MSNHYSAAKLRFPGDDARLDLTDLPNDMLPRFPYLGVPNRHPA